MAKKKKPAIKRTKKAPTPRRSPADSVFWKLREASSHGRLRALTSDEFLLLAGAANSMERMAGQIRVYQEHHKMKPTLRYYPDMEDVEIALSEVLDHISVERKSLELAWEVSGPMWMEEIKDSGPKPKNPPPKKKGKK